MACLWEPPSLSQVYTYNRHVPALQGTALDETIQYLCSDIGVTPEAFWQAFYQCNCGLFFTKEYLLYTHGLQCVAWPYTDIPTDTEGINIWSNNEIAFLLCHVNKQNCRPILKKKNVSWSYNKREHGVLPQDIKVVSVIYMRCFSITSRMSAWFAK